MRFEFELFIGFSIHEHVVRAVVVQVGHVTAVNGCGFYFHTSIEGFVHHFAGHNVLQLGAHESWAFTRLDVLELNDLLQFVVNLQHKTIFEIGGSCHAFSPLSFIRLAVLAYTTRSSLLTLVMISGSPEVMMSVSSIRTPPLPGT